MTFWCGFGSRLGSWIRILLFSPLTFKCQQKTNCCKKNFCFSLFEGTFTYFFKDKKSIKDPNSRNQSFYCYFCKMIEGSGSGSESILLTNGSGSGRPKNMWIRISNTANFDNEPVSFKLFKNTNPNIFGSLKIFSFNFRYQC
jgi:hypothetical protein